MINKDVYIIIINYKNYKDTIECVDSIRKQTYSAYKIVIVDNASNNESVDIIKQRCNDCKLIESQKNLGFSGANNLGADYAMAHGASYIIFLNNDTILKEDFLEALLFNLKDNECICPQMLFYNEPGRINYAGGYFDYKKGCGTIEKRGQLFDKYDVGRREVTLAQGCCIAMTAYTYKMLGPWKEEYFLYREDDEYTLRMIKIGIKIYYEPKAVLWHKENISTGKDKGVAIRNYYLMRNRLYNIKQYDIGKIVMIKTIIAIILKSMLFLILRKNEYKYYWKALSDFCKGITGAVIF